MNDNELKLDRADNARSQWEREKPTLGLTAEQAAGFDLEPMVLLGRLAEARDTIAERFTEPVFKAHKLKKGEFDVLATLRRAGAPFTLMPTDLYRSTMVSSGGMTSRLDKLEKAGHIARKRHPTDRRAVMIELTDQGKQLVEAMLPEYVEAQKRALSRLSDADREKLCEGLRKLLASLEDPA